MRCALCFTALPTDDSPWGVYFDTCHEGNMWGGDTFETRAYLCAECGERLQAQGGVEVKDEAVKDPARNMSQAELRAMYERHYQLETARRLEDASEETVAAVEAWLDKQVH